MSRATWTDERLDDFARNTDRRFDEVDRRFDDVVQRMESGFNRVDADLRELRSDMSKINARFDALQRIMLQLGGGAIATIAVGFAGLIVS